MPRLLPALLLAVAIVAPAVAADPDKDGYVPLFNGKDLAGWVNVNCAPGTFFVKDNEIVTTGKPIGYLRTAKQYENFVAEFEWMHVNKTEVANSGFFVWGDPLPVVGSPFTRGIEVQVLINYPKTDWATNHGDVFAIQGATCKPDRPHPKGAMRCLPSEERVKGGGEWNHYKIVANDGAIKLHVNGKEVSGVSQCNPRKGYLALESEGAECHFRNLKIKELPSTNPKPEQCAKADEGYVSLFDGLTLNGWKTEKGEWKVQGGVLKANGKAELVTQRSFGPADFLFDVRLPGADAPTLAVQFGGPVVTINPRSKVWQRVAVSAAGGTVTVKVLGDPRPGGPADPFAGESPLRFRPKSDGLEIMNVFARERKEK